MPRKVSVVIWHGERNSSIASWVVSGFSSDSVGSHAALIVWDDTGEFPVDYLSFYSGKNDVINVDGTVTQCCNNDNRHTSHFHSMLDDGFMEEDGGTLTTPHVAAIIDLSHDSFNVDSIRRYVEQLRASLGRWGFQKNCSDTVLEALRIGLGISSYSWHLYSNNFGSFFTFLVGSMPFGGTNPVDSLVYLYYYTLRPLIYFKENINEDILLFHLWFSHFRKMNQGNDGKLLQSMRGVYNSYKLFGRAWNNEERVWSFLYIIKKMNLNIPESFDQHKYALTMWNYREGILKYDTFYNQSFSSLISFSFPFIWTFIYTSLLNHKIGYLTKYNLLSIFVNIFKVGGLSIAANWFLNKGVMLPFNRLQDISYLYDLLFSLSYSPLNHLIKLNSSIGDYSEWWMNTFALISGTTALFKNLSLRDFFQIGVFNFWVAGAVKLVVDKQTINSPISMLALRGLLAIMRVNTPLMMIMAGANYTQRVITPNAIECMAIKLQNKESEEVREDMNYPQKSFWMMPSRSSIIIAGIKSAGIFAVAYAAKKYFDPSSVVKTETQASLCNK